MCPEASQLFIEGFPPTSLLYEGKKCISALPSSRDHDHGGIPLLIAIDDDVEHRGYTEAIVKGFPSEL